MRRAVYEGMHGVEGMAHCHHSAVSRALTDVEERIYVATIDNACGDRIFTSCFYAPCCC